MATYKDGKPCIVIVGWCKGAGVYIRHAVTLDEVRSLLYKENVYCVCISTTGTKVFSAPSPADFFFVKIDLEVCLIH